VTPDVIRQLARIAEAAERQAAAAELRALAACPAVDATGAGRLLGCSAEHVRDLIQRGALARVPHTARLLVATAELRRFAEAEGRTLGVAA
jgi:hypothetical protein